MLQFLSEEIIMIKKAFFMRHLNDHIQYLKKIDAAIKGEIDFEGTTHHECKLGQWLYNEGPVEMVSMSNSKARVVFDSLLEPHQRFHELGQQAMEKKRAGDDSSAKMLLTELHVLSTKITHILLELDGMN
jgi:hypothetical protein